MDFVSVPHLLLILVIVVVLFGAGKLPRVMGDFAKGIKAFKAGMREDDEAAPPRAGQVPPPASRSDTAGAPHEHA